MQYPRVSRRLTRSVIAAAALTLLLHGATAGYAAPQADLDQVAAQVREIEMQAGAAHEEASKAAADLAAVRNKLDSVRNRLARERDELQATQGVLADLARGLYASGGFDPSLHVLLADDPIEFLAQSAVMSQLAASQATKIRQAQTDRLRLAQTEAEISDKEAQAQELQQEQAKAEQQVSQRLEDAQALLATLQQAERERLAREQAQQRAQEEADARAAASQLAAAGSGGGQESQVGSGYTGGSAAARAVSYALSQVGDPYSFSANPPDSWDCSKLTAAAWAQAGVGLTALSYTQWDQTRRVPVSEIQPGDLVFYFGSGAHHVAIYVGNGKMVSASNPSDGVELIDFLGPWYKERFSGVGRVLG